MPDPQTGSTIIEVETEVLGCCDQCGCRVLAREHYETDIVLGLLCYLCCVVMDAERECAAF